ncbi:MAG: type IV toxin-antitoxin system AbiEi family antitoxin domain-containing protein [bacterium]|nr:type IV toxin-antitoxin system AbiEi family antitoxin domain-containing protein [bacterium]
MNYLAELNELIEQKKGIITTKDVTNAGIPRIYLSRYINEKKLERFGRGVYVSEDSYTDNMYMLQCKCKQAVFSHDTALFLHDFTDREPFQYAVTVKSGYNTTNIKNTGAKVYMVKKELYELGLTTIQTPFNHPVNTYDIERTICDIVRSRKNVEIQVFTDALKMYVRRKDKNLPKLMRYAHEFRIQSILRKYLEVLL